jgi:uncharacterized protein (TIGR03435 family)
LLAERFGLVVHRESKEVGVFVLTVAKGGLKMKVAPRTRPARECAALDAATRRATP